MTDGGVINIGFPSVEGATFPSPPSAGQTNIYSISDNFIIQNSYNSRLDISTLMKTGWNSVSDTWTYLSASAIIVPSGAVNRYAVGNKIKLTQTSDKYFYIVDVADTVLQIYAGTDYTLANAAISSPAFSFEEMPVGFSGSFAYTPTWTATGGSVGGGNTVLTGLFSVNNRVCNFSIALTMGTTTWFGTTTVWQFGLPIISDPNSIYTCINYGCGRNAGIANYFFKIRIDKNMKYIPYILVGDDGTNVSNMAYNVPFTWGNSDIIMLNGQYFI
jgi:hypothetical protein